jgi:L-lactate dehydrogenase complex protein LldE
MPHTESDHFAEAAPPSAPRRRAALFATCLVDLFRPSVGFAAAWLVQETGFEVVVPANQTCCGQPALNAGAREETRAIARNTLALLNDYEVVVVPSGSCAGMMIRHYPELFDGSTEDDSAWRERARAFSARVFELTDFLKRYPPARLGACWSKRKTAFHISCSCLRELFQTSAPEDLLRRAGLDLQHGERPDMCCGFGGSFSVKFPEVSGSLAQRKCASLRASGAALVLSADLGCLLHLAGRFAREGDDMELRHVAEVLADLPAGPAIGRPKPQRSAP